MDRDFIGNNFYNTLLDIGEDYTLTTHDGEEYKGKISVVAKTASSYMMGDREFLMTGVATFPDIESQSKFRGCYFTRQIAPNRKYILVSTIPKDTTEKMAEIYAIGCNATVNLAYLVETEDKRHNRIFVPEVYAENVSVYWDISLQKQQRSSDGNFDNTLFFIQIPAHYGLSQDEVVIRKAPIRNSKTHELEIIETRFRVESVDFSLSSINEDDETISGIFDVQLSLDNRG